MQILVVDEQDKIIGYKERADIEKNDIYRVSALWIKNSKGEILLAQRNFNKNNYPGKWGPAVTGTVEKGESYDQNILKEAKEELGLENINYKFGPKRRIHGKHNHFTQWYIATVDKEVSEFKFEVDEVEAIKWVPSEFLMRDIQENPDNYIPSAKNWCDLIDLY